MSRIIDIYLIYQFIRRLVTPFDQMEAFKQGIIDKDGKFLKKRRDLRTSAERNALGYFDVLIINLKKLLGQFPGGRTRLATYAAALYLIREDTNKEHSEEMLIEGLERYMKEAEPYLVEEAPTVSAGSGQIAGIGVGPDGEPGLTKTQQKKHRKRAANTGPIISAVMKRKKIKEDLLNENIKNIPFEKNPSIGWWEDQDKLTVYHGTHDRNVENILKTGLNKPDPKTGMISVTSDPYTAHGYAAMSGAGGEAEFRKAGGRPVNVPHEDRAVIKMIIPIQWLKANMDTNLSGNIGIAKDHLSSKDKYEDWKKKGKSDFLYYQLSEFRIKKPIPTKFIVGVMKKNK
jgi:hypothetical protein